MLERMANNVLTASLRIRMCHAKDRSARHAAHRLRQRHSEVFLVFGHRIAWFHDMFHDMFVY